MNGSFDVDAVAAKLTRAPPEPPGRGEITALIELAKQIFVRESNILRLGSPIIVVGDIHGQLYDLLEVFRVEAPPPEGSYLFLGDYVDRGYYSVEVLTYLLCMKVKFPERVFLLRGNHETREVTRLYGFYDECSTKYGDPRVYAEVCDLFDYFPLAALIDERVFGVHGGLSPSVHLLDQLLVVDRFREPTDGPLSDLLWGDPTDRVAGFCASRRGVGFEFGRAIAKRFGRLNRVTHITRAH